MNAVRLGVNIDHVATLRQARGGTEPDPVAAARIVEDAGADGITAHLREDRRHIIDRDIRRLQDSVRTYLNLEMACTEEMIAIALDVRPRQATLVPERREELTTEGGLDVAASVDRIAAAAAQLAEAGIHVSLFVDPIPEQVQASADSGVAAIELHTGRYANASGDDVRRRLDELASVASQAADLGLRVHAGHGLNYTNTRPVADLPEIEELNIGHSLVARAVFVGIGQAVREMKAHING